MIEFTKPHKEPSANIGRIDLYIHKFGKYENIIKKWVGSLERNGKNHPDDASKFQFGKIIGNILRKNLKKEAISPNNFNNL
ncbi:TPA: hypothetical protein U0D75_002670, partial [Legionella pneumophila]|nr:hypothetical protein [Legionella pneumophila]